MVIIEVTKKWKKNKINIIPGINLRISAYLQIGQYFYIEYLKKKLYIRQQAVEENVVRKAIKRPTYLNRM